MASQQKNKSLTSVLASCCTPEYEYGKSPNQAVNLGCRNDSPFFTSDLCLHGTSWYKSLYISSASVGTMKFGKNLILKKRSQITITNVLVKFLIKIK
jgi:hypothetical protein